MEACDGEICSNLMGHAAKEWVVNRAGFHAMKKKI